MEVKTSRYETKKFHLALCRSKLKSYMIPAILKIVHLIRDHGDITIIFILLYYHCNIIVCYLLALMPSDLAISTVAFFRFYIGRNFHNYQLIFFKIWKKQLKN